MEIKPHWIRRKIVVLKYTLQRGYGWAQVPTLALIGAGVLKPYFPNWSLWSLGIAAFLVYFVIGIIDRFWGFLHEETNYGVEVSPLLLKGLRGELKSEEKKEDDKQTTSSSSDTGNYLDLTK